MGAPGRKERVEAGSGSSRAGWRFLGWFGWLLALMGFGQVLLNFYPQTAFGSPEWEFGTMALILTSLPLGTMGLAGAVAAAVALGNRKGILVALLCLVILTVAVAAALIVFLTVVPLAIRGVPAGAAIGVKQTVAKTLLMGVGFGFLYFGSAVGLLRHYLRTRRRANA